VLGSRLKNGEVVSLRPNAQAQRRAVGMPLDGGTLSF
jgi:hypothetical protein